MSTSIRPVSYNELPETTSLQSEDQLFCIQNSKFFRINLENVSIPKSDLAENANTLAEKPASYFAPAQIGVNEETGTDTNINTGGIPSIPISGMIQAIWGRIRNAANAISAVKSTADTAIQSAAIGGNSVTKSGTQLQLPAYPTSLPANGGNADTLAGKPASDFAPAQIGVNAETGTGTNIITNAIVSNTVQNILQTIWNKIRQVANAIPINESGTWTPTGANVSSGSGSWTRIGKLVYVRANIMTTLTSENIQISGFQSAGLLPKANTALSVYYFGLEVFISAYISISGTINFIKSGTSSADLYISGCFEIN